MQENKNKIQSTFSIVWGFWTYMYLLSDSDNWYLLYARQYEKQRLKKLSLPSKSLPEEHNEQ